jgi:predicted metal-dependent hydrolase
MRSSGDAVKSLKVGERTIEYHLRVAARSNRIRVRVGPGRTDVLCPRERTDADVHRFLNQNSGWLFAQLDRVALLDQVSKPLRIGSGEILLRGVPTRVVLKVPRAGKRQAYVEETTAGLSVVSDGPGTAAATLEAWFRRQAREEIDRKVKSAAQSLGVQPGRLYIMDQRTKWASCSRRANLSFNWRTLMSPPYVLDYLVTHEIVHLRFPDHSRGFWLALQSALPDYERARSWLVRNQHQLLVDLGDLVDG